jgi:hypothetical protein
MKLKEFLEDFKNEEILNVKDLELGELENEYINLLNEFFGREVEDRDIVLAAVQQNGYALSYTTDELKTLGYDFKANSPFKNK